MSIARLVFDLQRSLAVRGAMGLKAWLSVTVC